MHTKLKLIKLTAARMDTMMAQSIFHSSITLFPYYTKFLFKIKTLNWLFGKQLSSLHLTREKKVESLFHYVEFGWEWLVGVPCQNSLHLKYDKKIQIQNNMETFFIKILHSNIIVIYVNWSYDWSEKELMPWISFWKFFF